MRRRCERAGLVLAMAAVGLVGLAALAVAAEEAPSPAPGGLGMWLENPVPSSLPFRLTGEADLGGVKLEGERKSPNFRTYRVIEEGFVANRFRLGLETKDQRWYMQFQGLDIGKDDQNYRASAGQYGRYRLDFEWDETPHIYGQAESPYIRSEGGMYNLPSYLIGATLATRRAAFNDSNIFDVKTRNDSAKTAFWWAPTPEWDLQLNYEHTRRAGTRPIGSGIGTGGGLIIELPEPIEWQIDQVNATIGYSTPIWQAQGGYSLSIFGNDIKTMTFDNYCFANAACPAAVQGPSQGRMVLAPDNQAHSWFVSGGLNLPMTTRISGKVSYGMNRQNDTFFTSAITGPLIGNPALNPAYHAPSLRGDLRTVLGEVTGTSRPIQNVNVTASYRYYGTDNRTLVQSFPQWVARETTLEGPRISVAEDYTKQNADLDVSYRILRPLTLRAGFGWERWDRPPTREVQESDEYSAKFGASYRALSWLDIVGRYTRSWKRIDEYNWVNRLQLTYYNTNYPGVVTPPQQRKFDEAARDRHKAELTFRISPADNFDVGITLGYGQDFFPFSYLGLIDDKNWSGAVDLAYTPFPWLTLRASYTREEYHSKQREANTVAGTNPNLDWISRNIDTYDTVGGGTIIRLIPNKLDLTADYMFQLSLAKVNAFNPSQFGAPAPTAAAFAADLPTDRFSHHQITTALRYWVLKNLSLRAGYAYERFRSSYWQADFIQPMITNIPSFNAAANSNYTFLGINPFKSYEVHIISGGVSYGF